MLADPLPAGTPVDPHVACAGCCAEQGAPETSYVHDGAGGVVGRVRIGPRHEGWAGVAHGGVTAMVLDDAAGYVLSARKFKAATARLEVDLRAPFPSGVWVDVTGRILSLDGRKCWVETRIDAPGVGVVATLTALAIEVGDGFDAPAGD